MTIEPKKADHPLINIAINIVIPVLILNKGSQALGAEKALLLALAFPLSYGLWEMRRKGKLNFISVLGFLNVLITGGLALTGLGGIWFAIKEAAFPALIGAFVLGSAFTSKPLVEALILNPQALNWPLVKSRLEERRAEADFHRLLQRSTIFLSLSFALSAVLNFVLALRIFIPLSEGLTSEERAVLLNQQVAEMTSMGFAVIFIPSAIVLMIILWDLFRGLTRITGLPLNDLMNNN